MRQTNVKVHRRNGRIHVDYGDPSGARATISPMENALALEVERLASGGAAPPDAVARARRDRELDTVRTDAESARRRAAATSLDADLLSLALTDLLAAIAAGSRVALDAAVGNAEELLVELTPGAVATAA